MDCPNILRDTGLFTDRSDGDSCHQVHFRIYWSFVYNGPSRHPRKKSTGDKSGDLGDHVQSIYFHTTCILHRYCGGSLFRQVLMHISEHLATWYALRWKIQSLRNAFVFVS
ncbi:hypothetical protein AVEN_32600-1 [Araneus ventricosus]|uniref:Uncharacterized protein n=1 Tax=Araneus ventricosus TaxID=182803 RepID=A0A4Y2C8P7_ARAVE|nr:hypothetical protein AVEN_32600-1 [Araneus ventricosus]